MKKEFNKKDIELFDCWLNNYQNEHNIRLNEEQYKLAKESWFACKDNIISNLERCERSFRDENGEKLRFVSMRTIKEIKNGYM